MHMFPQNQPTVRWKWVKFISFFSFCFLVMPLSYIAVVVFEVGAPEYYMLIGIHNYVDTMWGCRYGVKSNLAIVLNKEHIPKPFWLKWRVLHVDMW